MHRLLILTFLSFSWLAVAQPGVAPIIEINGKKYYQHKVEEGNTLWGMQTMYGVPYQEIIDANSPFDGLKKGETVLVPVKGQDVREVKTSEYKVKSSETLYGLSRKFNTTIEELIALNPELSEGLKKGQIIKVPGEYSETPPVDVVETHEIQEVSTPNPFVIDTVQAANGQAHEVVVSFSDSTVRHVVMAHETMYSISKRFMVSIDEIMKINKLQSSSVKEGQILIIPVKSERVDKVPIGSVGEGYDPESKEPLVFGQKDEYKVALLLPLYLDYAEGYSENLSNLAAQFYMGATMAIDSLQHKGLNAKVYVYDTKNDSASVQKVLEKPEFSEMDLVIGPLMEERMGQVARFCKANKVRMVCPVGSETSILEDNRLVYASVPSNITMMQGLARYFLDQCQNDHILLIKPLDEKSMPLYEAFRKALKEFPVNGKRPTLTETTVEGFNTYIQRGKNNHFVVPTSHRSTAVKFMNNLNRSAFRAYKDDVFVYGTKEWVNFSEMNDAYKNKYNFHFPSPNHLDYYTDAMVEMNKAYRARYKTDMSRVAVQAYDVLMYYCSDFFLGQDHPNQLMNDIDMKQISDGDGYENSRVFIIEQEEYELIEVARPTVK